MRVKDPLLLLKPELSLRRKPGRLNSPSVLAMMAAMELHFETTIERPHEQVAALLRAGPEAWLPDIQLDQGQRTVEIAVEEAGRRFGRRVRVTTGAAQPFGYGVAVPISWQAVRHANLYPELHGALRLDRIEGHRCRLRLDARYEPPAGRLGAAADRAVMNRVARNSVQDFFDRIVGRLHEAPV